MVSTYDWCAATVRGIREHTGGSEVCVTLRIAAIAVRSMYYTVLLARSPSSDTFFTYVDTLENIK